MTNKSNLLERASTQRVTYEWTVETIDEHGDIIDNHFADTLDALPDGLTAFRTEGFDVGLVRDVWEIDIETGQGDLIERSWSYIHQREDGSFHLFKFATQDGGSDDAGAKIPQRFHDELTRAVNNG